MVNEEQLINDRELRDSLAERYDVLEKVKELLLIPNAEFSTIKQVAAFYEVGEEAIKSIVNRNDDEFISDGLRRLNRQDTHAFLLSCKLQPKSIRGGLKVEDIIFNNRSNTLLPRRSILRIGMLLRDSEVAKEVRSQLLNIEEKVSDEIKISDISEEQELALGVGMSFASGNPEAIMIATTKMMNFKNRHILKLEANNKALAGEILEWKDRAKLNAAVRKLAGIRGVPFATMWNELYRELQYKHHIAVKMRGGTPYIQWIKEEEWKPVLSSFSAICEKYGVSPAETINQNALK